MLTTQTVRDRLDAIEARLAAIEQKPGKPPDEGPKATCLELLYLGLLLFVVEGKTGVWCGKPHFDEPDTESLWAVQSGKRGLPRMKRLYRLNALSERMAMIFSHQAARGAS